MTDLIERKAAAIKNFNKIGKSNGTAPPESESNSFGLAYEFFMAGVLRDVSKARYESAREQALAAGILEEDYTPGTHVPYRDSGLSVVAKRNNDSTTLDSTKLKNELTKKLGEAEAKALLELCSKVRKGNLTISVSMD